MRGDLDMEQVAIAVGKSRYHTLPMVEGKEYVHCIIRP